MQGYLHRGKLHKQMCRWVGYGRMCGWKTRAKGRREGRTTRESAMTGRAQQVKGKPQGAVRGRFWQEGGNRR